VQGRRTEAQVREDVRALGRRAGVRQQPCLRVTLVQVAEDGDVLGQHDAVDRQRRHFAFGIHSSELGRFVLTAHEPDEFDIERDPGFLERDHRHPGASERGHVQCGHRVSPRSADFTIGTPP
jgi:hypothetical protein